MRFRDRIDAGRRLAQKLRHYAGRHDVIVLGLARGGVPVAFELARSLRLPLDVFTVRKIGLPGHSDLAVGALATGGVRVINEQLLMALRIRASLVDVIAAREQVELVRRDSVYRGELAPHEVAGRTVILVDDGLVTGATMLAAVESLRQRGPARIVVALPVAAARPCDAFRERVDEIVCLVAAEPFLAISRWYDHFPRVREDEVRELIGWAAETVPLRDVWRADADAAVDVDVDDAGAETEFDVGEVTQDFGTDVLLDDSAAPAQAAVRS